MNEVGPQGRLLGDSRVLRDIVRPLGFSHFWLSSALGNPLLIRVELVSKIPQCNQHAR